MNSRQSPLFWSFPVGVWFSTRVRISVFFPLLIIALAFKYGLLLGSVFSAILFVSVLLHEFGHVIAARRTGGLADEILIWPLGGLAYIQPAPFPSSQFLTAAAGPAVNLMLCGLTLPFIYVSNYASRFASAAWNPFVLPGVSLTDEVVLDVLVLVFAANWMSFLVNMIPVSPLDGSRMLQCCLSAQFGHALANEIYIRAGFVLSILMMVGGLIFVHQVAWVVWLVVIGAVLLVLNMQEASQLQSGDSFEESFMGYDFSQGYTSLERSASREQHRKQRSGFWQRWREKRRQMKLVRSQEKELQAEVQVDIILAKVQEHGLESLSMAEKRELERASNRYKKREKRPG